MKAPYTHPATGEITEDPEVRPFADWLREQADGKSHDELSDSLHELVARVQDTGKRGRLVFTIAIEPMKEDPSILVVTDEITLKLPEYPRKPSVFYTDRQGNLSRSNPMQPELTGLRDLLATTTPTREVS